MDSFYKLYEHLAQNKKEIFAVAVVLLLFVAGNYYMSAGDKNIDTLGAQLLSQSSGGGIFISSSSSQQKCEQKGGVFSTITLLKKPKYAKSFLASSCSLPIGQFQPVSVYSPGEYSCETIAKGIYGTWYSPNLNSAPVLVCMLRKPVNTQVKDLKSCQDALGYYTSGKKCYFSAP